MGAQLKKWNSSDGDFKEFIQSIEIAVKCYDIIKAVTDPALAMEKVAAYLKGKENIVSYSTIELLKGLASEFHGPLADFGKYIGKFFTSGGFLAKMLTIAGATAVPCCLGFIWLGTPVKEIWNKMVDAVMGAFPSSINVNIIMGFIPIRRI